MKTGNAEKKGNVKIKLIRQLTSRSIFSIRIKTEMLSPTGSHDDFFFGGGLL